MVILKRSPVKKPDTSAIRASGYPSSPCPVCKSEQTDILYAVTPEEAAQHFVLREGDYERHRKLSAHIERLWHGSVCVVRRCLKCQFGFADPYVGGDAMFYQLAYPRAVYPSERWEYGRTIETLEKDGFEGQRVLEVGAGFGAFLDKIADDHAPRSGITALEFSNRAIEVLREKGYRAIQEDIRSVDLEPGFDAVFLFQVVEHLDGLDLLFSRLAELVRVGGRVFISVPNAGKVDFQESSGSLLDMPPNHIGRWSRSAFPIIAAAHHLEVNTVDVQPFAIASFIKEDIGYGYLRKAQESGTLLNWSRAQRGTKGGKLLGAAFAVACAPLRVPVWCRAAAAGQEIGGSFWVDFARI